MSRQPRPDPVPLASLGRRVAAVLRGGTLLAVAAVGIGFVLVLVTGDRGPGNRPLPELIGSRGPDAFTAAGMFALTLLPIAVALVAAVTFAQAGERRHVVTSLVVLGLLAASLVVAALFSRAG